MARITAGYLDDYDLGLTVDRYQEIMKIPQDAFNGLNNPAALEVYDCSHIWKQSQRDELALNLAAAESRREAELGYHLSPKYIVDEEHTYDDVIVLDKKRVIEIGVETTETIESGVAISHSDLYGNVIDPVILSITTSVTDTDEIAVFYPSESVRIRPSSVTISGGVATIKIPRCRLIDPDLLDDRADPLAYATEANFISTVDVKRVYASRTSAITLVWPPSQLLALGLVVPPSDTERTQAAVGSFKGNRAKRIGSLYIYPATFSGETATGAYYSQPGRPDMVRVSYRSGQQSSPNQELLTARLAHTLMPGAPCSCPLVAQYWTEDRKDSPVATPYGLTQGALHAWMADSRAKIGIGGMF